MLAYFFQNKKQISFRKTPNVLKPGFYYNAHMKGKVWVYILIVLGSISIVISVVIIVGSILFETKIVSVVNSVYQPVQNVYEDADQRLMSAEDNVSSMKNEFHAVSSRLSNISGTISDQNRQTLTNGVDKVQGKVTKVEDMLGAAKDAVNTVNKKIDVVNSLKLTTLPKLSDDRVSVAIARISDTQKSLNTLKSELASDGTRSKPVVTVINQGFDSVQNVIQGYHSDINDAQKKAKNLRDAIILWSITGTVFIVLFFIWSIYSFVYLIKNQFKKLKSLSEK